MTHITSYKSDKCCRFTSFCSAGTIQIPVNVLNINIRNNFNLALFMRNDIHKSSQANVLQL